MPCLTITCRYWFSPSVCLSDEQLQIVYIWLLSSGVQPVRNLQAFGATKRGVSYTFTASPTSGASYKVTFIPQRSSILQPPTETFTSGGLRTKSRLVPDVTYRIQVVAVVGGIESTAMSVNFTTLPDGELRHIGIRAPLEMKFIQPNCCTACLS